MMALLRLNKKYQTKPKIVSSSVDLCHFMDNDRLTRNTRQQLGIVQDLSPRKSITFFERAVTAAKDIPKVVTLPGR